MKAFGIRPKRDLGQNFLIDSNLLDVIARAAELGPDDVVLEVGGGLGVLSRAPRRAGRATSTSSSSTARSSRRCATRSTPHPNTTLHLADAVKLDLAALDPAPDQGRREPARTASPPRSSCAPSPSCPQVTTWVAMVQKEVGERFAAQPGTSAYGVP